MAALPPETGEDDRMAFTVTVTERPRDEAGPGRSCDGCDPCICIPSCGVCICIISGVAGQEPEAVDLEDWAAAGLSPVED